MTDNRGIPRCILQTELQNSKMAIEQHNTANMAILEGGGIIEDLFAIRFFLMMLNLLIFFWAQFQILSGMQLVKEYLVKI